MTVTALTIVHKIIRFQMFEVATLLFRSSAVDLHIVQEKLNKLAGLLHEHAEHEDLQFAPVLALSDPGVAERMKSEHIAQEVELTRMIAGLAALPQDDEVAHCQVHLDFCRFMGEMLLHLDEEERRWAALMQSVLPPVVALAAGVEMLEGEARRDFVEQLRQVTTPSERRCILGEVEGAGVTARALS